MKYLQRYLSVLLCFLLLSSVFSTNVSAAENVDTSSLKINIYCYDDISSRTFGQLNANNNETQSKTVSHSFIPGTTGLGMVYRFTFADVNGKPIFRKGKTYSFSAENLTIIQNTEYLTETRPLYVWNARFIDSNSNSTENVKDLYTLTKNSNTGKYRFEFKDYTPEMDIYRFTVYLRVNFEDSGAYAPFLETTYGADPFEFKTEQKSDEAGLLSGLIGWVTNIFNKIGDIFESIKNGFSNMAQGFVNLLQSLSELPSKLWTLISDGLKSLFVPDYKFIEDYKQSWDSLLSIRLGALYQAVNFVIEICTELGGVILSGESSSTIEFPEVSLSFGETVFTFGGWNVDIIPEGFDTISSLCRSFSILIMVFIAFNTLKRKYDRLVGDNT